MAQTKNQSNRQPDPFRRRKSNQAAPRVEAEMFSQTPNAETWRIFKIMSEFVSGFELLRRYRKAVSFFGSARFDMTHPCYQEAVILAGRLAKDGYAVITGGASGVMEAANRGAFEAGGASVGLNINLPQEQSLNRYITDAEHFDHFFVRKVMLAFASQVYIFFPGGFGTLDEFFELTTLVQTKKVSAIPIILVGHSYWSPLLKFIDEIVYQKNQAIAPADRNLYHLAANADEAYQLVKKLVHADK